MINAPSVQPPSVAAVSTSTEPEQLVRKVFDVADESIHSHPVVSQKKKAKKAREAKRKARKLTPQDELVHLLLEQDEVAINVDANSDTTSSSSSPTADWHLAEDTNEDIGTDSCLNEIASPVSLDSSPREEPSPISVPITRHGKHVHWSRFTRNFIVDQLTTPFLSSLGTCYHGTSCAFEDNDVLDCPFHQPRKSTRVHQLKAID